MITFLMQEEEAWFLLKSLDDAYTYWEKKLKLLIKEERQESHEAEMIRIHLTKLRDQRAKIYQAFSSQTTEFSHFDANGNII